MGDYLFWEVIKLKKIIGIIIGILLICTIILPVSGRISLFEDIFLNVNTEKLLSDNSELKLMIAGSSFRCLRAYRLYIPSSYDGSEPVPLVFVYHGGAVMGEYFKLGNIIWFYRYTFMETYSDFNNKAEEEGFIVVYPKSLCLYYPSWNSYLFAYNALQYPDSWFRWRNLIDDVGFTEDLIDKMQRDYNIDSDRIYLAGLSAGADMTYSLGCVLSDKIAAISPVAGVVACKDAANEEYIYPPDPDNPVSVMIFHGTDDRAVPWEGNEENCAVNDSVQFWVEHNGCDSIPNINISESGKIVRYTYSNGIGGSEVILYMTVGGDHWWPGNNFLDPNNVTPWLVDSIQEIDATDLIWEFFESHPKQ